MDSRFVGRKAELAEVKRLLGHARLVTLTGVGGVGKTRLALRAAERARPGDGTVTVELDELSDPDLLPAAVASALGLAAQPSRPRSEMIVAWLSARCGRDGKGVLLVLDTCEHVVDAAAALVTMLLRAVPDLRIMATSRQPLGVAGEHIYVVPPMSAHDATHLLRDRLVGTKVAEHDEEELARLCALLDDIPLAIDLAATRLRTISVPDLIAHLDNRYDLLSPLPDPPTDSDWPPDPLSGVPGLSATPRVADVGPLRHATLRAAMGWSHALCSPRERLLWARMSVFAGAFDLQAAEHVCSGGPLPAAAILDTVSGLVDKSILFREEHLSGVRYRILPTVGEFGAEWLQRLGELDQTRRRHHAYSRWLQGREQPEGL